LIFDLGNEREEKVTEISEKRKIMIFDLGNSERILHSPCVFV
jgi:hypothetical protein